MTDRYQDQQDVFSQPPVEHPNAETIVFPPNTWWEPPAGTPLHDDTIGLTPQDANASARSPRGRTAAWKLLAGAAVVSLSAGGIGGAVGYSLADSAAGTTAAPIVATTGGRPAPAAGSIGAVAAAVSPSVVNISNDQGAGSGFVVRDDGYILTNNHVVGGAENVKVTFEDGSSSDATVVGSDAGYDLAVVKVDKQDLPAALTLGTSGDVKVGDTAIAVGSPLGLQGTVTSGIISALDRPVTAGSGTDETSFINALQTDAAINPGNSGGPLVDGNGHVIGVNSAIASLGGGEGSQAGSIGLGFAIPIDTAQRIANELIDTGQSSTPIIGVEVDSSYTGPGAKVGNVTEGGAAEAAGLQPNDVIVAVDGENVADSTELIVDIRDKAVGDEVTVTVERDGSQQDLTITLDKAAD